jgi:hypothetical protein
MSDLFGGICLLVILAVIYQASTKEGLVIEWEGVPHTVHIMDGKINNSKDR